MYEVIFASKRVERALQEMPRHIRPRLVLALRHLEQDPRPKGARKLKGKVEGTWRIRIGDYRVLYDVDDDRKTVVVLEIGPRRSIYRHY